MTAATDEDQLQHAEYEPEPPPPHIPSPDDVPMGGSDRESSPDIILLDSPPRITIALPQITVKSEPEDKPDRPLGLDPPDDLLDALEPFILASVRMQATRRLPFLRRGLREGFLRRCSGLQVPVYRDSKEVTLGIVYESVDGIVYRTEVSDWLCPLCSLFGAFNTQEMLKCHLDWDHVELFFDWKLVEDTEVSISSTHSGH